ncbi:MAG: DNA topoisomerase [Candidatus Verstraetearchaeota archaeon]|nr:DNA topoisomerase [Candidatus Verstraetearchaeota archaeon]
MDYLIVTEKPSVAIKIKNIIGISNVVALKGHFLELDFSDEYNIWRKVNPKDLFKAPIIWKIRDKETYYLLENKIKNSNSTIVIATDNDPEGELIGYEVLLTSKKVRGYIDYRRMRFNSVTSSEIINAWKKLEYDLKWNWVWKALFRHKFDLITGAAYTRLLTLSGRFNSKLVSWGSCQAPTLWFVYKRELEIRNFKPEKYWTISAIVNINGEKIKLSTDVIKDKLKAQEIYYTIKKCNYLTIKEFELTEEIINKPLPTDTDSMLQEVSKIFDISGTKIMKIAEELYANGFISYPRTETNMWIGIDHREILKALSRTPLGKYIDMKNYNPVSGKKNDGAHPPIYPTGYYYLSDIKGKIWEYIARRYLANVVGRNAKLNRWRITIDVNGILLTATGKYFIDRGFFDIFPYFEPKRLTYVPQLYPGYKLSVVSVKIEEKETKPPSRLTESELLKLLEENSIGTDATRADYPNLIVERGYSFKKGKRFYLSEIGEQLINLLISVDERLVTPETRRYVEKLMNEVESNSLNVDEALSQALKIYEDLYEKLLEKLKLSN